MGRNVATFIERSDASQSGVETEVVDRGMKTGAGRDWDWRPFVYGGLASCVAEIGTFPFDLTKTRLQLQGSRIDNVGIRYRGMFHAFMRIGSEEGARALYSGIAPALLRQSTYGTLKIGVYYSMKKFLVNSPEDETFHTDVFCGVVAGAVSSTIANPTDVLKVRMQACSQRFKQVTMVQAFSTIYEKEGIRGLWRGVAPTSQRAALIVGIELPVYDMSKVHLMRDFGLLDNEITHFISSAIAGLACALASNPIDVVKTRLMNQARLKATVGTAVGPAQLIYTSSLDCVVRTVKYEGVSALYKGFIPTYVRMGPWNVIFFMTYEQMKKFY